MSPLYQDFDGNFFFGTQQLRLFDIKLKGLKYDLVQGKPVLTDMGADCQAGGMDSNMDVSFPPEFQKSIPFSYFVHTNAFSTALGIGIVFSAAMSVCLYGIWKKLFTSSKLSIFFGILLSFAFLTFEAVVSLLIITMHVYPRH